MCRKRRRYPFSIPYLSFPEILSIIVRVDVHKILAPNPHRIPPKRKIPRFLKEKRKREKRQ